MPDSIWHSRATKHTIAARRSQSQVVDEYPVAGHFELRRSRGTDIQVPMHVKQPCMGLGPVVERQIRLFKPRARLRHILDGGGAQCFKLIFQRAGGMSVALLALYADRRERR